MSTVFHPGVQHNHSPSRRWADIQANPRSSPSLNLLCSQLDPQQVVDAAILAEFHNKPIATAHLRWYLSTGHGRDFVEDTNIRHMLTTDRGVQRAIAGRIPRHRTSRTFTHHFELLQHMYVDQDLRYAFGAIDRLDFEVDFTASTLHVWFMDRYEWHPVYPGVYTVHPGDSPRDTNCVHAALVELKTSGARDYWMKGDATVPLAPVLRSLGLPPPRARGTGEYDRA